MALENPVGRAAYRKMAKTYRSTYKVDFNKITPTPGWNIRTMFDGIDDLANDIASHGIREPLVGDFSEDGMFHIVDGERRYQAIKLLVALGHCFDEIEVRPLDTGMTMLDKLVHMMSSGIQKKDYTALEYSTGVKRMKEEHDLTNEQIGEKLGKSRQWVDMMLILAEAPEETKAEINAGNLSWTSYVNGQRKSKKKMQEDPEFKPATPESFDGSGETIPPDDFMMQGAVDLCFKDGGEMKTTESGVIYADYKDPSLVDMNHGIIAAGPSQQTADRPLDVQELEKQMENEANEDEVKVKNPELDALLKRMLKNINWIERIGRDIPNEQVVADLDTRLRWLREDNAEIRKLVKSLK